MAAKVWFITGISSGLGKALATYVTAKGDYMIGTFRKQTQVTLFNAEQPANAKAVLLDVTDTERMADIVEQVILDYGRIDVLVNNAGLGFVGAIEETHLDEVRAVFETNFFGALTLTQLVLPYMRNAKQGQIIQVSSHGGLKAFAGFGVYNASKFALEGFSEAMAQEVAPLGLKVTLVEPGPFRTNFAGGSLGQAKTIIQAYAETAGAFRMKLKQGNGMQEGDPEKAAKAIVDLVYSSHSTLRLPLGKIAISSIEQKISQLTLDLETHRTVAENAVF